LKQISPLVFPSRHETELYVGFKERLKAVVEMLVQKHPVMMLFTDQVQLINFRKPLATTSSCWFSNFA